MKIHRLYTLGAGLSAHSMTLATTLAAFAIGSWGLQAAESAETAPAAAIEPETAWVWHWPPTDWRNTSLSASGGLVVSLREAESGEVFVSMARSVEGDDEVLRLRPVAFDSEGNRIQLKPTGSARASRASNAVELSTYLLAPSVLPLDEMEKMGIEKLTKTNRREILVPEARRKLSVLERQGEAEVMPHLSYPHVGDPYRFELKTIDGKTLRSRDFEGQVVLVDFWARWCAPCMQKMPELKDLYSDYHDQGFEVIGVNLDYDLETATQTIQEHQLPWPNTQASLEHRELWKQATGISGLPRLLLIDRKGILREDVPPHTLREEVERLLGESR